MSEKQYSVLMEVTVNREVTVEAESEEEALAKAEALEFVDPGIDGEGTADWKVIGKARQVYP